MSISAAIFETRATLPGVFVSNANQVANRSLWTVPYKVLCYMVLVVLAVFFRDLIVESSSS